MKKDIRQKEVLKAFAQFGFAVYSFQNHIKLENEKHQKVSIPNHKTIKSTTLSDELRRVGIDKKEFAKFV